ncbi:MAG: choice-of-anchor Q domain-containing protein [Gemmataceae bacterium]
MKSFLRRTYQTRRSLKPGSRYRTRLEVMPLEGRDVPSTYTVNLTGDAGGAGGQSSTTTSGDLRWCIVTAQNHAGDDSIVFDKTVFASNTTISLATSELSISNSLTSANSLSIKNQAKGHITVNAPSSDRVLEINANGDYVSIQNLDFEGGDVAGDGGGILSTDTKLDMTSCTITMNTASGNGGGICATGGDLTLYKCQLGSDPTVSSGGNTAGVYGGGLFADSVGIGANSDSMGVSLSSCTVGFNLAGYDGGALNLRNGPVYIGDTTIAQSVTTNGDGGAIWATNIDLFMVTTTIDVGSAPAGQGGGLFLNSVSSAFIDGSQILNGIANGVGGGCSITGGGVIAFDSDVFGTVAAPNSTASGGAGLSVHDSSADVTVTNSSFEGNVCGLGASGGGVQLDNDTGDIIFDGCTISQNVTDNLGGGFCITLVGNVSISNCLINYNLAHIDPYLMTGDYDGAGVFIGGNDTTRFSGSMSVSLTDCTISNNDADGHGGGISILDTPTVVVINRCEVDDNGAGASGGGIAIDASLAVAIKNSAICSNSVQDIVGNYGGGIAILNGVSQDSTTYNIQSCTIYGNYAERGGGIAVQATSSYEACHIYNTTISGNTAHTPYFGQFSYGGGIYFYDFNTSGVFELLSTIVADNKAPANAGPDVRAGGTHVTANYCLIGIKDNFSFGLATPGSSNNIIGTPSAPESPGFITGIPDYHGGPTKTISLTSTSKAIDAGSNPLGLSYDQRGVGYPRTYTLTGSPPGDGTDIGAYELSSVPMVASIVLDNDGTGTVVGGVQDSVQRSEVRRIIVTFTEEVSFTGATVAGAFTLARSSASYSTGTVGSVGTLYATPSSGLISSVTITFSGSQTDSSGSLVDGVYNFTIDASQISGQLGNLNSGTNVSITGSVANKWFRFFGDANGDGTTDQSDYLLFRNVIAGGTNSTFDYDNDGDVDQSDYLAFRNRLAGAP